MGNLVLFPCCCDKNILIKETEGRKGFYSGSQFKGVVGTRFFCTQMSPEKARKVKHSCLSPQRQEIFTSQNAWRGCSLRPSDLLLRVGSVLTLHL